MYTWERRIFVAALLAAGCNGTIGANENDNRGGPGSNGSGSTSGDGTGTGSGGGAGMRPADPTVCVPGVPQTSQLPRLTRAQYDNTVRDLLGIESQPSSMLAPDSTGSVDRRAWDGYKAAASSLATEVLANATARARVVTCASTANENDCAIEFIQSFGQRAFRRPLTVEEVNRFHALYTNRAQITATGTFDEAVELIVRTFLLSPSFLTRAELAEERNGNYFALSAYEVASRLSYMLWGSMPDDTLFSAAASGALSTPEQILAQAQRMLADSRARAKVSAFHQQYAHMGDGTRWADIAHDSAVFPSFSEAVVPFMIEETQRFFDHVVYDLGGTFKDVLTSPVSFVNASLAPLYGLDPAQYGQEMVPVSLDPATRSGVFTRVGFLASYSLFNRSSPILRGAFIQKEVLCREIGAPPPDAESTPLPATGATNRERVDAQTSADACKGCHHTLINPTGFALEAYDAIGAYQQTEGGVPINTSAAVPIGDNVVNVNGPVELFQAIADSPEAKLCYARKWVQAAYERALTNEDSCTAENLATKLTEGGYTVLNLVADLTQADSFRFRAVPEVAP